jgi:DNA-binding transcriptional LysR family regulator
MGTIDLDDVGAFAAVVETGTFSAAARRLGVRKSSVSRALARLEEATGVSLLHRTTRKVTISTAGKAFYEKVHAELASLRHAVEELPRLEGALSGSVRVSCVVDMADFFADAVARFVAHHPAAEIDLRLTNEHVDLVAEGIDLALRFSTARLKDSSLNARKLFPNDVMLFAAPSYLARRGVPRTPADLDRHEWVVYRRKTEIRLERGRESAVVHTRGRIACDDFTFLRAAIVRGCGVGYLDPYHTRADVAAGRLVPVLPEWVSPISSLWAVWPGPRKPPRKVDAFVEAVMETIRSHPFAFRTGASTR